MRNDDSDTKDLIRCEDGECVYYIPKSLFAELVLKAQAPRHSKYVRYKDGAKIYGMSVRQFTTLARDAGAISKINRMVLVNTELIDKFIEYYRMK